MQGFRIAGNVDDVVEILQQAQGGIVYAGARRIDKHGGKRIIRQPDALLLQAAETAHALVGLGELFGGKPRQADVGRAIGLNIPLRRLHRSFRQFRGQHAAEITRQRQGEIAVAAIKLQQIAAQPCRRAAGPIQHFLAHQRIGLAEAAFVLAIEPIAPVGMQAFGNEILRQHQLLPPAAADNHDAQFALQTRRRRLPLSAQPLVVNHAHQHIAAQGGQKFALIPPLPQQRIGLHGSQQSGHHSINRSRSGRQGINPAQRGRTRLLPGLEHGIADMFALVPNPKFGTHPIMLFRRSKHLPFGWRKFGKTLFQVACFLLQLGGVFGAGLGHRECGD